MEEGEDEGAILRRDHKAKSIQDKELVNQGEPVGNRTQRRLLEVFPREEISNPSRVRLKFGRLRDGGHGGNRDGTDQDVGQCSLGEELVPCIRGGERRIQTADGGTVGYGSTRQCIRNHVRLSLSPGDRQIEGHQLLPKTLQSWI